MSDGNVAVVLIVLLVVRHVNLTLPTLPTGDKCFHRSPIGNIGQINYIGMPKPVQGFLVTIDTIHDCLKIVPMVN